MPTPKTPKTPDTTTLGDHPEAPQSPEEVLNDDLLSPENFINANIRRQAAIFTQQVGDKFIIYDPLGNTYLRLNKSAHDLWVAVGDHERIPVSEVVSASPLEHDDAVDALITLADENFIAIVTT